MEKKERTINWIDECVDLAVASHRAVKACSRLAVVFKEMQRQENEQKVLRTKQYTLGLTYLEKQRFYD